MIGLFEKYRHTIVINTKDGETIRGVYWGTRRSAIRLRQATVIQNGQPVEADGEIVVFRENVSFLQRLFLSG